MADLFDIGIFSVEDTDGAVGVGWKLWWYQSGTSTPRNTYPTLADAVAGTNPNSNPVISDGGGRFPPIWLRDGNYKVTLTDNVNVVRAGPKDPAVYSVADAFSGPTGADMIGMTGGGTVQDYIDNPGTAGPIDATFTGIPFTNAVNWSSAQFASNGATPGAWYSSVQAGNKTTDALTAGILVPSTATNHQTNGISSFVVSQRAQPANGGDVAAYFQIQSNHNNCAAFALNTVAYDTAGMTGQKLGIELDYNVNAADTEVNGINLVIVGNLPLVGNRNALAVRGVFSANSKWSNALVIDDGATELYSILIGCTSSANNVDSQPIAIRSRSSGGTLYTATILADRTGGMAIRPGSALGSVAFQDPTGATNWASINGNALTVSKVVFGLLTFANLPAAAASAGMRTMCSNSTTNTFNAVVAGGGANIVPVFSDGTSWRVG